MRRAVTTVVLLALVMVGGSGVATAEPTAVERIVAPPGLEASTSDGAPDLGVLLRSMGAGTVATDGGAIGGIRRDRSIVVVSVLRLATEAEAARVFDLAIVWTERGEIDEDGMQTRVDPLDSPASGGLAWRNRTETASGQESEVVEVLRRFGRDLVFAATVSSPDVTPLQQEVLDAQTAAFPDEIVPLPDEDAGVSPVLAGGVAALLLLAGFAVIVGRRRSSTATGRSASPGASRPLPGPGGPDTGGASVSW